MKKIIITSTLLTFAMFGAAININLEAGLALEGIVLRRGDRGESVSELIKYLSCVGYYHGYNSGIYSLRVESAVKKFQIDNGLKPDGIANQQVINLVRIRCAGR